MQISHHDPVQAATEQHQLTTAMQQCIEDCIQCHTVCMATVHYCLKKGGNYAQVSAISQLLDCAEICETSANFMLRASVAHASICHACAIICERCATACEALGNDEALRACVDACRKCTGCCKQIVSAQGKRASA